MKDNLGNILSQTSQITDVDYILYTLYSILPSGRTTIGPYLVSESGVSKTALFDTATMKVVNTPGSGGVLVYTTKSLSVNAWNMQSDFDCNAIKNISILA
jgi:hypothetical protein